MTEPVLGKKTSEVLIQGQKKTAPEKIIEA